MTRHSQSGAAGPRGRGAALRVLLCSLMLQIRKAHRADIIGINRRIMKDLTEIREKECRDQKDQSIVG